MKAVNIFIKDPETRARIVLYLGLVFNIIYSVFNLWTGLFYRSVWFGAVSVYYVILCVIKYFIIKIDIRFNQSPKNKKTKVIAFYRYRQYSILLLLLNLLISIIIIIIIHFNISAEYSNLLIFPFGIYTLIRIIYSVITFKRLPHIKDPFLSASRHLGISVTLMSMFSVQTALLDRFCKDTAFKRELNMCVGIIICVIVIAIAIRLIVISNKGLKKAKEDYQR